VQYEGDDQVQTLTLRQTDVSGNIKEEWCYQSGGQFSYHTVDTLDPRTDVWTWTNYAEDGSVKVAIETQNGKVHFYRQNVDDPNVFGQHFFLDPIGNTQHSFRAPDNFCKHFRETMCRGICCVIATARTGWNSARWRNGRAFTKS
jgi:hypothetical protein